jgi:type IV secretion system protein VirB10
MDRLQAALQHNLGSVVMTALRDPEVVEIMLNPDQNLWVERLGEDMEHLGTLTPACADSRRIRSRRPRSCTSNHFLRVFGSAVLVSLISGGSAYAMDRLNNSNQDSGSSDAPSMQDSMAMALANQLGQTTARLLEKSLNIKPTLEIRPGYRFNIIVTKDIVFEAPYAAWR